MRLVFDTRRPFGCCFSTPLVSNVRLHLALRRSFCADSEVALNFPVRSSCASFWRFLLHVSPSCSSCFDSITPTRGFLARFRFNQVASSLQIFKFSIFGRMFFVVCFLSLILSFFHRLSASRQLCVLTLAS